MVATFWSNIYFNCIATYVQDLGAVVHVRVIGLRVRSQALQVGVERHSKREQLPRVYLSCQMALLHQAGFIRSKAPEMPNIQNLTQRSEIREGKNIWDPKIQQLDFEMKLKCTYCHFG